MTTGLLVMLLRRRWYVVLICLCLTAGAMVGVHQRAGLYWAQVDVVFLAPKSPDFPNTIQQTTGSVIAMAGLVEAELNKGTPMPATASAGATLAGQGVRDGYLIRVPSTGGQWAPNFDRPVIDLQVIGPDLEVVQRRLADLVGRIRRTLETLQVQDGARRSEFITTATAPTEAQVIYLDGKPTRALGLTLLLGLTGAVVAAVSFDSWALRRRRRSRGSPRSGGPDDGPTSRTPGRETVPV